MATLRNLLILACAMLAKQANGKRVKVDELVDTQESATAIVEHKTLADTSFVCPEECTECCVASWGLSLFDSRSSFKCVLAPGKEIPEDGRECGEVETRNSDPNGRKTECEFTDDEKAENAHKLMDRCTTSAHQFQCPDECQECCQAGVFLNMRTSRDRFKCILKEDYHSGADPKFPKPNAPASRKCGEVKLRDSSRVQAKTECDYTEEDKKAEAWNALQRCSSSSKCCCDEDENWSETLCLPLDKRKERELFMSPKSNVQETYVQAATSYDNTGQCQNPESIRVAFDKWTDARYPKKDLYGCCLKTKMSQAKYEWRERKSYSCSKRRWCGRHPCSYRTTCHKTVTKSSLHPVEVCDVWETLYHCSGPDTTPQNGIHRTGNAYIRISTKQGQCISNEPYRKAGDLRLTTRGKCPAGYAQTVTGKKCQCEDAC